MLWYVPPCVATAIEEGVIKVNPQRMKQNSLRSITIEGHTVYPFDAIQQCTHHLRKIYETKFSHLESTKKNTLKPFKLALLEKPIISPTTDTHTRRYLGGNKDDVPFLKSPTELDNLLFLRTGYRSHLILIEGAPGVGKTTLTRIACLRWARQTLLTDITLLVLFPLRDHNLRQVKTLDDLLSFINQGNPSLIKELRASEGEGVAFWLDGWDEIASTLKTSSIYKSLVARELLPKVRLIITSRPWATKFIKKSQHSKHIEIVSSVQDEIHWLKETKELMASSLKHNTLLDEILVYLSSTPTIREHMATPLATTITLEVYQWCLETHTTLPTTVTQLYRLYTCCCIHKYIKHHQHFHSDIWRNNDLKDLPEPLKTWFTSMCRLGLEGLLDGQRLVFSDIPAFLRLETLGLMEPQDPLYISEKPAIVSYHYKHLSLQEFLFAQLLTWLSTGERSKIVQQCVGSPHFTAVLRFLCGLTKIVPISTEQVQDILRHENHREKLTVFHWLYEGCDENTIAKIISDRRICVHSDYTWSALDYFMVSYCMARSQCEWNIDFNGALMGDERMLTFLQNINTLQVKNQHAAIASLKISSNELTTTSLCLLKNVSCHLISQIREFDASSNILDATALKEIAAIIPLLPQVIVLNLSWNPNIGNGGAVTLLKALCNHKNIEALYLQFTNIGEADCTQLGSLLNCSKSLVTLNIGSNSLSSNAVQALFDRAFSTCLEELFVYSNLEETPNTITLEAMAPLSIYLQDQNNCKLMTLDLTNCSILQEAAAELAHGIAGNTSLKMLRLCGNPIGDKGILALASALCEHKTISELDFMCCDVTTNGGLAFASALPANLKELYIGGNSLGGKTIQKFAELLKPNCTLEIFDIRDDVSFSLLDTNALISSLMENRILKKLYLANQYKTKIGTSEERLIWI